MTCCMFNICHFFSKYGLISKYSRWKCYQILVQSTHSVFQIFYPAMYKSVIKNVSCKQILCNGSRLYSAKIDSDY